MRAWSFAAIGVIVIQSVLMLAYVAYADTSTSSRFRLQDSFSVVAGGSEASSTMKIRDRAGESAPTTWASRLLQGVPRSTGRSLYNLFARQDAAPEVPVLSVPVVKVTPDATPTTSTPTSSPETSTPIPGSTADQPVILDTSKRAVERLVEPIVAPTQQFLGSRALTTPSESSGGQGGRILVFQEPSAAVESVTPVVTAENTIEVSAPTTVETIIPPTPQSPTTLRQRVGVSVKHSVERVRQSAQKIVRSVAHGAQSVVATTTQSLKQVPSRVWQLWNAVKNAWGRGMGEVRSWFQSSQRQVTQLFTTLQGALRPGILSAQTIPDLFQAQSTKASSILGHDGAFPELIVMIPTQKSHAEWDATVEQFKTSVDVIYKQIQETTDEWFDGGQPDNE